MGDVIRIRPGRSRPREVTMTRRQADNYFAAARLAALRELFELDPSPANKVKLLQAQIAALKPDDGGDAA
jgi:hypothetical protein